jgi:ABC-type Fe3+/spermidine/putrescine transport system ATPase subunit
MESANVIIRNVSKSFGNYKALDNVSLEIAQGSFTTLLGPSGCGKTTLLRCIAGFYHIEEGEIYIDNQLINSVPSHLRNAIMVFQDYALFPHMTVKENITYGLRIRKLPQEEINYRLQKTIEYLDIKMLLDRTPGQISGGQQQRVALARALIMEPKVLLLDEPLSNLDANLRNAIRSELRQLQQRLKITTIYVTHDQAEALAMSDSIAVINEGRIIQIGSPTEIYYHPANKFVASFVGIANFIEGSIAGADSEYFRIETKGGTIFIKNSNFAPTSSRQFSIGSKVVLVIRPESLKILDAAHAPKGTINIFQGEVYHYIFEGSNIRYWIKALNSEIIIDMFDPGESGIKNGIIDFQVDPSKAHMILI